MSAVLVIEDDYEIARLLTEVLTEDGFTVTTLEDPRAALGHLQTAPADVVMLDWLLGDMDGEQLHALLRDHGVTTPIIFCTAYVEARPRAEALGARFVAKPFDIDEVVTAVRSALAE